MLNQENNIEFKTRKLDTPEGLAQAMVKPIRRALEYGTLEYEEFNDPVLKWMEKWLDTNEIKKNPLSVWKKTRNERLLKLQIGFVIH